MLLADAYQGIGVSKDSILVTSRTLPIHKVAICNPNAAESWQRSIDIMVSSVRFFYVMVYHDDIILFSRISEEHLNNL